MAVYPPAIAPTTLYTSAPDATASGSGASGDEAANALKISPATADRMWRYAKAWLQVELMNRKP
ncbi:MAG TPA: ECF-type sigma factor [Planctomycetota bacterium]|nr:ECF-type sigma factor [Planctomycetota bacterium]